MKTARALGAGGRAWTEAQGQGATLAGRHTASRSELPETFLPGWEECGSGLSGQKGPRHRRVWLGVPALPSECRRVRDLEGFAAKGM